MKTWYYKYILAEAALVLLFLNVAHPQRISSPTPHTYHISSKDVRAIFDSGFGVVSSAIPSSAINRVSKLWPLFAVARFYKENIGWALIDGETYRAVESGPHRAAWFAVVPNDAPSYGRMKGPLQLDLTSNLLVLQIAAEPITVQWAGVFLFRYASILSDYAQGVASIDDPSRTYYATEFRGYQIELMAADALSKGKLRRAIDTELTNLSVNSVDDLFASLPKIYPIVRKLGRNLLTSVPPRTKNEEALRNGFMLTAVVIRYCETHEISPDSKELILNRFSDYLKRDTSPL